MGQCMVVDARAVAGEPAAASVVRRSHGPRNVLFGAALPPERSAPRLTFQISTDIDSYRGVLVRTERARPKPVRGGADHGGAQERAVARSRARRSGAALETSQRQSPRRSRRGLRRVRSRWERGGRGRAEAALAHSHSDDGCWKSDAGGRAAPGSSVPIRSGCRTYQRGTGCASRSTSAKERPTRRRTARAPMQGVLAPDDRIRVGEPRTRVGGARVCTRISVLQRVDSAPPDTGEAVPTT